MYGDAAIFVIHLVRKRTVRTEGRIGPPEQFTMRRVRRLLYTPSPPGRFKSARRKGTVNNGAHSTGFTPAEEESKASG